MADRNPNTSVNTNIDRKKSLAVEIYWAKGKIQLWAFIYQANIYQKKTNGITLTRQNCL